MAEPQMSISAIMTTTRAQFAARLHAVGDETIRISD